jgi:DNA end-binding protein Ku
MPSRPHWKGYLKLSLVSCPVALVPAITAAERVSFRQVNRETGHRLRQQLVDAVTGEVVERHNKARGYETGEHEHLIVEEQELEQARQEARASRQSREPASPARASDPEAAIGRRSKEAPSSSVEEAPSIQPEPAPGRIENMRTIEIERFIPNGQLDPRYYNSPYYIMPRDEVGQEAFAVIRDAMARKDVVGLARVILSKRERPIMIAPMAQGLCGVTLRYAHEVRSAEEYFDSIPQLDLPDELMNLAEHIIATKAGEFDPAFLEDRYRSALVTMLKEKQADQRPRAQTRKKVSSENIIDLMEVLRRSVAAEPRAAKPTSIPKPPPRRAAGKSSAVRRPKALSRKAR